MIDFRLTAEARHDKGKGASRRLRRAKKVPAILYGAGGDTVMLALDEDEVLRKLQHEAFYSHILTVKIGDEEQRAVLKDLQRHPFKPLVQHVDLQRVSESEEIRVRVPLHFVGADVAPGVKIGGGVISHLINEVEVSCLPKDLPEFLSVDLSNLDVGEAIHLSGVQCPPGVEIVELSHGPEHDLAVVSIHKGRMGELEEGAPVAVAGAAPATGTP